MKFLKTTSITLSCLFMLSACVIDVPNARWYKEGVSANDTKTKLAKCQYDIGMNKVEVTEKHSLIQSCMMTDGFRWGVPRQN